MKKFITIMLVIATVMSFGVACGTAASDKEITISPKSITLEQGDELTFTAELKNVNGEVAWASSDETVLQIDAGSGKATAKSAGTVTVTATADGVEDTATITVTADKTPVIEFVEKDIPLYIGDDFTPRYSITYEGAEVKGVKGTLSVVGATDVIKLEGDKITALKEGAATVTVTAVYRYFTITDIATVTVTDGSYVAFSKTDITLSLIDIDDETTTSALVAEYYESAVKQENADIQYEIADEEIVSYNGSIVTALKEGQTTITATYGKYTARANITVKRLSVKTDLSVKFLAEEEIQLPEFSKTNDFDIDNVNEIIIGNKNVFDKGAKKIDKNVLIGSAEAKIATIKTAKADYEVELTFINAEIKTVADLNNLKNKLSKIAVNSDDLSKGYYFDGYVTVENDITYTGEFTPIFMSVDLGGEDLEANSFRGVFDGKNHTISDISLENEGYALFWSLTKNATVKNLSLKNVRFNAKGTAGIALYIRNCNIENVYVSGTVKKDIVSATKYNIGFIGSLLTANNKFNGVTIEVEGEFDDDAKFISAFGYFLNDGNNDMFTDCSVINTDKLYGWTGGDSDYDDTKFVVVREKQGISSYAWKGDYLVARGYTLNQSLSKAESCLRSGEYVYEKDSETVIAYKAKLAHQWETVGNTEECSICHSKNITGIEADVKNGLDYSDYIGDREVASISSADGDMLVPEDGVIKFENDDAASGIKEFTIILTDGSAINLSVKIWSLIIRNEADLLATNDYLNNKQGFFKLDDDITLTADWDGSKAIGLDGFAGVFDGNGKTIKNLHIVNGRNERGFFGLLGVGNATIKNMTVEMKNDRYYGWIGGFAGRFDLDSTAAYDVVFEGLTLKFDLAERNKTTKSGGGLLGQLPSYMSNITIKDSVIIGTGSVTGTENSCAALFVHDDPCYAGGVTFEGLTLVNIGVLTQFVGGGTEEVCKTAEDIKNSTRYATMISGLDTVKVYESEEDYSDSDLIKIDDIDAEAGKTIDFTALVNGKTVKSVTLYGSAVATSVTYSLTDASDVAKKYYIETEDGSRYYVLVTVWSLIIDDEAELLSANDYLNGTVGYFKLNADITLTADWDGSKAIGLDGFAGVFDGNGKTIKNLHIVNGRNERGFFGLLGVGNATIKNMTVEMKNDRYYGWIGGFAGRFDLDSTAAYDVVFEGLTLKFDLAERNKTTKSGGGLLGQLPSYMSNITIKDSVIIGTGSVTGTENSCAALFVHDDPCYAGGVTFEGLTLVNIGVLTQFVGGGTEEVCKTAEDIKNSTRYATMISGLDTVKVYESEEEYNASLN